MPDLPPEPLTGNLRHSVGVDLVSVSDVARSLATFGNRYMNRLYTADEIRYCLAGAGPAVVAERFAARFAAKEATFKALRWGNRPTDWRSVEVRRTPEGWCTLELHDDARRVAEAAGLHEFDVSMSHDGDRATAVVTAWPRT